MIQASIVTNDQSNACQTLSSLSTRAYISTKTGHMQPEFPEKERQKQLHDRWRLHIPLTWGRGEEGGTKGNVEQLHLTRTARPTDNYDYDDDVEEPAGSYQEYIAPADPGTTATMSRMSTEINTT